MTARAREGDLATWENLEKRPLSIRSKEYRSVSMVSAKINMEPRSRLPHFGQANFPSGTESVSSAMTLETVPVDEDKRGRSVRDLRDMDRANGGAESGFRAAAAILGEVGLPLPDVLGATLGRESQYAPRRPQG